MTIEVNPLTQIVEVNPPAAEIVTVSPQQVIVEINVTAPGGFYGGLGVETFLFSRGVLTVSTGGIPIELDGDYEVESYTLSCGTAPTGAAVILDINKNGTTIFTTQANRPTIAAGTTDGSSTAPDVLTFTAGDKITVDIDQIGSSVAGANLSLVLRLRRLN